MANVQLNIPGCTSITFSTSGVKVPAAGVVTSITAAEAQNLVGEPGPWNSFRLGSQGVGNGNVTIWCPATVTSITVNGSVYNAAGGFLPAVIPADATAILTPPGAYLISG